VAARRRIDLFAKGAESTVLQKIEFGPGRPRWGRPNSTFCILELF